MNQLDLFQWADSRPSAKIIDIMPAVIKRICAQPHPFPRKDGEVVSITMRRKVA